MVHSNRSLVKKFLNLGKADALAVSAERTFSMTEIGENSTQYVALLPSFLSFLKKVGVNLQCQKFKHKPSYLFQNLCTTLIRKQSF